LKSLNNPESMSSSNQIEEDGATSQRQSGVVGNERLTALAGSLLLVLLLIELASAVNLHAGMTLHLIVGVLLSGPLLVKLGSTGYRFLRYYTGAPTYQRKGPPRLPLRVLAPPLVIATLAVVGSGIGLVVTGPLQAGPLLPLHNLSVLVWFSLIAVHVGAYLWRTPRLITDEWTKQRSENQHSARFLRLSLNLGALLAGAVAAILLFPGTAPWLAWSQRSQTISGPLVVGLVIATLVLVASRPWRWR
jgi:hypothetical protein